MHPTSLLTAYQGGQALFSLGDHAERRFKRLKSHELATLRAFCDEMKAQGCGVAELDGFFVGYAIERISKEFDLLRFSDALILNIELKAPLRRADKEVKIRRQMRTNHHYLSFLGRPLRLFTFVDKDGFYEYLPQQDQLTRVDAKEIADLLRTQKVDPALDPDTLFVPANYLISPFRDSARFIKGQYFLTTSQQSVKEEILRERKKYPDTCFTLSAASGTGKTLLLYDLAKTIPAGGGRAALVHCAPLNEDQRSFRRAHGWCIHSAAEVHPAALACQADLLLVDETQHLSLSQLNALIAAAEASHTTLLLAFDTAPELGVERPAAILAALRRHHPQLRLSAKSLSDKIRINSALAAFIANLFKQETKPAHPPYNCITIDYLYEPDDLRATTAYLSSQGWTILTGTASGPGLSLAECGARDIAPLVGSEFSGVATVLDRRFFYDPTGHLQTTDQTSAAKTALYQIVTRATDELRLIVYNNPTLYLHLLRILEH